MSKTVENPRQAHQKKDPPMIHMCFLDSDVALCGKPLRGGWKGDTTPVDCVVCADLDRQLRQGT